MLALDGEIDLHALYDNNLVSGIIDAQHPEGDRSMDINLNADLGESFGAWRMGDDAALLAIVGSANVACGFHAGDPLVMADTVRLAAAAGVSLGAHPAFPDLQGFGRRVMQLSPRELAAVLTYQVGALMGMAQSQGPAGDARQAARRDEQHGLRGRRDGGHHRRAP